MGRTKDSFNSMRLEFIFLTFILAFTFSKPIAQTQTDLKLSSNTKQQTNQFLKFGNLDLGQLINTVTSKYHSKIDEAKSKKSRTAQTFINIGQNVLKAVEQASVGAMNEGLRKANNAIRGN